MIELFTKLLTDFNGYQSLNCPLILYESDFPLVRIGAFDRDIRSWLNIGWMGVVSTCSLDLNDRHPR